MLDLKMEVYSPALELLGFLQVHKSVIWEEKAFSSGSFSVDSLITPESLTLLRPENIIWIEGDTAGIIEYVDERADVNGPYITVKGYTLTGILGRRILWGRYNMAGTPPDIMHRLVDDCCINPTRGNAEARKIPGLVLDEPLPPTSRLPDGYTELEYIQSSGTQHIDTGYSPNSLTRTIMDLEILSGSPATAGVFGARESAVLNSNCLWIFGAGMRTDYGATGSTREIALTKEGRHFIDKNKNITTVDGQIVEISTSDFQCNFPMPLFTLSTSGSLAQKIKARLFSCQIYDNDILVRDYIPCANPSGAVGLYDDVSKTFFGNAGSGVFSAGPLISVSGRTASDSGQKIRIQRTGSNLLDTLTELGETYGVAFGVRFNAEIPRMEFWTRWGRDLTVRQSNNPQVFYSTELDDVLESEYTYNSQDYRNVSLVAGEGEGDDRMYVTVEEDVEEAPDVPVNPPAPPEPTKYTVELLVDPEGGGTASGGKTVAAGVSITVTASPAVGYEFAGWSEGGQIVSTSTSYTFTVNADRTLTAVFAALIPVYTVTASIDPAGSGTVTGAGKYQEGTEVTITATPAEGYTFGGWQEGGVTVSESAAYTFTVTGNRAFVAAFAEIPQSRLPAGYTEVEYIHSDNACGIDTGINPIVFSKIKVEVEIEAGAYSTGTEYIFSALGYKSGSFTYFFSFWRGAATTVGYRIYTYNAVNKTETIANKRISTIFDGPGKTITIGDVTATHSITSTSEQKSNLFIWGATATQHSISGKLYSAKVYNSGGLRRDFVPCINPSGAVGLYDLVGGGFYGNAFSGTLTAGPAV